MVLHPAIIALLTSSIFITGLVLYSARIGVTILVRWDLTSGSELQLELERKTYLISTVLANAFVFQLVSLFLYIFTADRLHSQFVGAMCAAGTLYLNGFGYPALMLKIVTFLLAGLWLILDYTDTRAYDYPLVRTKYLLLLVLTPFPVRTVLFLPEQGSLSGRRAQRVDHIVVLLRAAHPPLPVRHPAGGVRLCRVPAVLHPGRRCVGRNRGGAAGAVQEDRESAGGRTRHPENTVARGHRSLLSVLTGRHLPDRNL